MPGGVPDGDAICVLIEPTNRRRNIKCEGDLKWRIRKD